MVLSGHLFILPELVTIGSSPAIVYMFEKEREDEKWKNFGKALRPGFYHGC